MIVDKSSSTTSKWLTFLLPLFGFLICFFGILWFLKSTHKIAERELTEEQMSPEHEPIIDIYVPDEQAEPVPATENWKADQFETYQQESPTR
jgi:hypothetical protein